MAVILVPAGPLSLPCENTTVAEARFITTYLHSDQETESAGR